MALLLENSSGLHAKYIIVFPCVSAGIMMRTAKQLSILHCQIII